MNQALVDSPYCTLRVGSRSRLGSAEVALEVVAAEDDKSTAAALEHDSAQPQVSSGAQSMLQADYGGFAGRGRCFRDGIRLIRGPAVAQLSRPSGGCPAPFHPTPTWLLLSSAV